MSVFTHAEFDHHEQVVFCHDPATGLRALIALHSTALGPAAGGCRMYPYASIDEALTDVLRLSKGMSYKNALAGLPLGGGKSVIIADPAKPGKRDLLLAFAAHVQRLNGRYWTAIDVGVSASDADVLAERCAYTFARASQYPDGFEASMYTALGGFAGIRAVAHHLWGSDDLTGRTVSIQGLGAVGRDLARRLHEAGAKLIVTDVYEPAMHHVVEQYGARAVNPAGIHAEPADIFAPCALGAILNDVTIPQLQVQAVCGVANNQLGAPRHGAALRDRGIVYAPDYVVNAGGMIGAGPLIWTTPQHDESVARVLAIYDTVRDVLARADAEQRPTSDVADDMARARLAAAH